MNKTVKYNWTREIVIEVDEATHDRLVALDKTIEKVMDKLDPYITGRRVGALILNPLLTGGTELTAALERLHKLRRLIAFGDCQVLVIPMMDEPSDVAVWESLAAGEPPSEPRISPANAFRQAFPVVSVQKIAAGIKISPEDLAMYRKWLRCPICAMEGPAPLFGYWTKELPAQTYCLNCGQTRLEEVPAPSWEDGDPLFTCPDCGMHGPNFLFWRQRQDRICPNCDHRHHDQSFVPQEEAA